MSKTTRTASQEYRHARRTYLCTASLGLLVLLSAYVLDLVAGPGPTQGLVAFLSVAGTSVVLVALSSAPRLNALYADLHRTASSAT